MKLFGWTKEDIENMCKDYFNRAVSRFRLEQESHVSHLSGEMVKVRKSFSDLAQSTEEWRKRANDYIEKNNSAIRSEELEYRQKDMDLRLSQAKNYVEELQNVWNHREAIEQLCAEQNIATLRSAVALEKLAGSADKITAGLQIIALKIDRMKKETESKNSKGAVAKRNRR